MKESGKRDGNTLILDFNPFSEFFDIFFDLFLKFNKNLNFLSSQDTNDGI